MNTSAVPVLFQPVKPQSTTAQVCETDFPLHALGPQTALAVITRIEGASYRPLGAAMAIEQDGKRTGSLSSGCLERDVALHAQQALQDGSPRFLRYGTGSPFADIELPCGGGLEIAVLPYPKMAAIAQARARLAAREPAAISITSSGAIVATHAADALNICIRPQPRMIVFGKGPEASCFARIAQQAGYPVELFSPDDETLAEAGFGRSLTTTGWPDGLNLDPYSAVVLFFHDHDREPALLAHALQSPAFLVGAQGSLRAHKSRCAALQGMGLPKAVIDRLASPFGLIPSTRDPRTLAVSVLAQVLDRAAGLTRA